MAKFTRTTLCWLVLLALGGLAFWAGRAQACGKACNDPRNWGGACIYSGNTGQILKPTSACNLWLWSSVGAGSGNCNGSQTCGFMTCVGGDKTYCHAPAAGEYSVLDTGGTDSCGSCSGSTTVSGCSTCS